MKHPLHQKWTIEPTIMFFIPENLLLFPKVTFQPHSPKEHLRTGQTTILFRIADILLKKSYDVISAFLL